MIEGKTELSKDVVALVHHVELNESGWLGTATKRAVGFLCWLIGEPVSAAMLVDTQSAVGLKNLSEGEAQAILQVLCDDGSVVVTADGKYRLTEAERLRVDSEVHNAEDVESKVSTKVIEAVKIVHDLTLPEESAKDAWSKFRSEFIVPFITEFGAKSYELILGQSSTGSNGPFLLDFLAKYPDDHKPVLETMVLALLDRNDLYCRKYILHLLNNYFFQSALTIPKAISDKAFNSDGKSKNIKIVLDTNFLFSLLKLHTNPSNEAVGLLLDLISKLPSQLSVRMYVLPTTITEFQRSLTYYEGVASTIRPTQAIVAASRRSLISGVVEAFLIRAAEADFKLSAKDYFAPYYDDIRTILGAHNVNILHGEDDHYATDQPTIDDAVDQKAFYAAKARAGRREKSYETIWHDMVLWHYVDDRRPDIVDSIFDAQWVGVTIDYSLLAFDIHKRHGKGLPVIVHPASLIQALQTIIPTDEDVEKTILALMQLPFLFDHFDVEEEKATQRILSTLSRFEHVDELGEETVIAILGNRALRAKFHKPHDQNDEVNLIREELVTHLAEHKRISEGVAKALEIEQRERASEHKEQSQRLAEIETEKLIAISKASAALTAKEISEAQFAERERKLQGLVDQSKNDAQDSAALVQKILFGIAMAGLGVLLSVSGYLVWHFAALIAEAFGWLAPLAVFCTVSATLLLLFRHLIGKLKHIEDRWYVRAFSMAAKASWALYAFLLLTIGEAVVTAYSDGGFKVPADGKPTVSTPARAE